MKILKQLFMIGVLAAWGAHCAAITLDEITPENINSLTAEEVNQILKKYGELGYLQIINIIDQIVQSGKLENWAQIFFNLMIADNNNKIWQLDVMVDSIERTIEYHKLEALFASFITKENIHKVPQNILKKLVDEGNGKISSNIPKMIAQQVTKENIFKIDYETLKSLTECGALDLKVYEELIKTQLATVYKNFKENRILETFFFAPSLYKELRALVFLAQYLNLAPPNEINFEPTQSEAHMQVVAKFIEKQFKDILGSNKEDRALLLKLLYKVSEEESAGNITFIHGQQRYFFPLSQTCKRIVELQKYQGQAQKGHYPLRFVKSGEGYALSDDKIKNLIENGLKDHKDGEYTLCMNAFLLGNAENRGSYSLGYWLGNHDQSDKKNLNLNLSTLFKVYGLEKYYESHKKELNELENEFIQGAKRGSLLLLSLTPDQVQKWVYPSSAGRHKSSLCIDGKLTDDIVAFMKALKDNPMQVSENDLRQKEWCLVLSDQSMDPVTGVKIYPFNSDEDFTKQWCKKLDTLFVKIKKDIDSEKEQKQPTIIKNKTFAVNNLDGQLPEQAQVRLAVLMKQMHY